MKNSSLFLILMSVPTFAGSFCVQYSELDGIRQVLSSKFQNRMVELSESRSPRYFIEDESVSRDEIVTICAPEKAQVDRVLRARFVRAKTVSPPGDAPDEVFTLIENGPPKNRVNLVFMGDGYTASEKPKFLTDMKRLTAQLFEGKTFSSYLPIFNVYAVFRASNESGIGKNDIPKDTAYKLYRQGNTLRAIFPGNGAAAHDSCAKAPGCNYPILIGNDPYYGGLGGEFSISTSSESSGMVVLRHELGHSVGDIGEEYDGGGYFGANHSSSLNLSWKHWLTGPAVSQPSIARNVTWPWVNLSSGSYQATLTSDGLWSSVGIQLSVSGAQTDSDVKVTLDDHQLSIQGLGNGDRDFYGFTLPKGLPSGTHTLKFEEGVHDGDNWVSNITVHEYKNNYNFNPENIGAYPLFSGTRAEGYRPTHDTCLMRNMKSDRFCRVCQENNWVKFFGNVEMIDSISVSEEKDRVHAVVTTQPLGQFRKGGALPGEHVEIRWIKNGVLVASLNDQTSVEIEMGSDQWEVEAKYVTSEVKKDPLGVLKTKKAVKM